MFCEYIHHPSCPVYRENVIHLSTFMIVFTVIFRSSDAVVTAVWGCESKMTPSGSPLTFLSISTHLQASVGAREACFSELIFYSNY